MASQPHDHTEIETKVLDVSVEALVKKLEELGAEKAYDDGRTITHFEDKTGHFRLHNLKLTDEGKLKLSISRATEGKYETVKLYVSRKDECVDFFGFLGFHPIAEVKARRTSFEWKGVDLDIDQFPQIPAFLEIDLGHSGIPLDEVLKALDLEGHDRGEVTTPELYKKYGLDYFELFKSP